MPLIKGTTWTPFTKYGSQNRMATWDNSRADHYRCGPFYADLRLDSHIRGRSAINFKWVDRCSLDIYYMHLSEFMNLLTNKGGYGQTYENNKYIALSLSGWFTFRKQGTSHGIVYLGRSKPK